MQTRAYAADAKASPTEVSSILEQRIRGVQEESGLAETGRVLSVGYVETVQPGGFRMRRSIIINHSIDVPAQRYAGAAISCKTVH
jgi:hypothetical protein